MNNYGAYRQTKIESGLCYQDFIVDLLLQTLGLPVVQYSSKLYQHTVGESRTGVEIKHDELYARTGNLWIEVAEKAVPRPGPYAPSGIDRDDNSWLYVIGDYDTVFIFGKTILRGIRGRYSIVENSFKTSMGFRLPDMAARRLALYILTPRAEHKIAKAVLDLRALGRELHRIALGLPPQASLFGNDEGDE